MPRKPTPIADRFWPKVKKGKQGACWEWQASLSNHGYGKIGAGGKGTPWVFAHRVSFEIHNGPIPEGLIVRHSCDNPKCVNPDHLILGTKKDNTHDMMKRGRHGYGLMIGEKCGTSVLTEKDIIKIRKDKRPQSVIASEYGVKQAQISKIKLRQAWKHVP